MNDIDFWDNAKTAKLINVIKKYPAIWNKAMPSLFYDREQKSASWNRVADEMKFPLALIKQKYKRLYQMYYSESHKKLKNPKHKITCKFYRELELLIGRTARRHLVKANNSADEIYLEDTDESDTNVAEEESDANILWNDKKIREFIEILKRNPILLELNSNANEAHWQKVAKKLGCNVKEVKLQKKSLTMMFHAEYKKLLENPNFKTDWKYFEALKFLGVSNLLSLQPTNSVDDVVVLSNNDNNEASTINKSSSIVQKSPTLDENWSYEDIIELIDLVRSHRVIWDENDADYFNLIKQQKAWAAIGKRKNLPVQTLKDKFNSLRTTYYNERKQVAEDPSHIIGWIYFPCLEFLPLPKKIEIKNANSTTKENIMTNSTSSIADLVDSGNNKEKIITELSILQNGTTKKPKNNVTSFNKEDEQFSKGSPNKHQIKQRDEYTIFGEAVANEMRQMHDYKAIQTKFRTKVLKILSKAREAESH